MSSKSGRARGRSLVFFRIGLQRLPLSRDRPARRCVLAGCAAGNRCATDGCAGCGLADACQGKKDAPVCVVGNLPYNITSPILFNLLDARDVVQEIVVTMQREVAERLVAVPRTKAYGILSVLCQALAHPEILFRVSPHVFYPRPAVTSAVVRLTFSGKGRGARGRGHGVFFRSVVRTAFNRRRKTLRNGLERWTKGATGIALPEGMDARRPEELTPEEFVALARYLKARV